MDEDEHYADENGAFIAKEKDPEANRSAARKQQRWGLLTNIFKVNTLNCLYSVISASTTVLVAEIELQRCVCHSCPWTQH